jgi:hypothetical protein
MKIVLEFFLAISLTRKLFASHDDPQQLPLVDFLWPIDLGKLWIPVGVVILWNKGLVAGFLLETISHPSEISSKLSSSSPCWSSTKPKGSLT